MTSRGRVLIADDEETFLFSTAELLRREGYQCVTAADGAEVLARLATESFDVLISDLDMPGNVDLGLIREALVVAPTMTAVIATGAPSAPTMHASLDLAVARYLLKPIELDHLFRAVEAGVARSRAARSVLEAEKCLEAWRQEFDRTCESHRGDLFSGAQSHLLIRTVAAATKSLQYLRMARLAQSASAKVS